MPIMQRVEGEPLMPADCEDCRELAARLASREERLRELEARIERLRDQAAVLEERIPQPVLEDTDTTSREDR